MKLPIKFIVISSLLVVTSTTLSVFALTKRQQVLQNNAALKTRTLTIDMTKFALNASGNTTVKTTAGNNIGIYYYMNRRGLYNKTAITNLDSVTAYYSSSEYVEIGFGNKANPSYSGNLKSSGQAASNSDSTYKYFFVDSELDYEIKLTKVVVSYRC